MTHACLERFSDVFLRAFKAELRPRRRRRQRAVRRRPPQDHPTPFRSREEWLTWCERDRQAELQEWQEAAWTLVEHYPRRAA